MGDLADNYGYTALIYATCHGREPCVQALIDAGCNLDLENNDGDTALDNARTTPIIRALVNAGCQLGNNEQRQEVQEILQEHSQTRGAIQTLMDHPEFEFPTVIVEELEDFVL